jgi:hypothetical protein
VFFWNNGFSDHVRCNPGGSAADNKRDRHCHELHAPHLELFGVSILWGFVPRRGYKGGRH